MWWMIISIVVVITVLFLVSREDVDEREYYDSPRYRARIDRLYGGE